MSEEKNASVKASSSSQLALPLDIRGTAFQRRVWQVLREIPAGTIVTYSEIAKRIGTPKAVRAVASACAANKIAADAKCGFAISAIDSTVPLRLLLRTKSRRRRASGIHLIAERSPQQLAAPGRSHVKVFLQQPFAPLIRLLARFGTETP